MNETELHEANRAAHEAARRAVEYLSNEARSQDIEERFRRFIAMRMAVKDYERLCSEVAEERKG